MRTVDEIKVQIQSIITMETQHADAHLAVKDTIGSVYHASKAQVLTGLLVWIDQFAATGAKRAP